VEHPPQQVPPLVERRRQERAAVEMEQVEGEERDRPATATGDPPGELVRVGSTGFVDRDELAVEDRRAGIDPDRHPGQLGQRRADVPPFAVDDPDISAAGDLGRPHERERAKPAPRGFEQVDRRVERLGDRSRKHRPQAVREVWQRRDLGFEPQRQLVAHRRPMVALDSSPSRPMHLSRDPNPVDPYV
jgi:hypothetical protein